MIKLPQVAQLVHDDVIAQIFRQERDTIIEIQVALPGTASPARLLISYGDAPVGNAAQEAQILEARADHGAGVLFMQEVMLRAARLPHVRAEDAP